MKKSKMEIVICLGSSCFARGNKGTLEVIKNYLKINELCDEILFKGQLCSQSCNKGPVIWVNDVKYEAMTAANVDSLLDQILKPSQSLSNEELGNQNGIY